jgi:predicted RNase H-like HicB family nuclease
MIDNTIDIGMNELLKIEDDPAGRYFVLWPFGSGPHFGNAYRVQAEETGHDGLRVSVPAMPGFVGVGETRQIAESKLVAAIKAYLYTLKDFLDRSAPLIPRYIIPDPSHPGEGNALVQPEGISIWAIIGSMRAERTAENHPGYFERFIDDMVIRQTAADYGIPEDAVRAAVAYYYWHKAPIDARIDANSIAA